MDWSNRFTFGGFIVSYSSFQMAWEVIKKKGDYEVDLRWFSSKLKTENFCISRMKIQNLIDQYFIIFDLSSGTAFMAITLV